MTNDDKGTEGNQPYAQEATQKERRAMLKQRPGEREPTTLAQIARGDNPETQRTPVTGFDQLPLVAPQWAIDAAAVPNEPPLGFRVDDLPDMTTQHGDNVAGNPEWEYDARGQAKRQAQAAERIRRAARTALAALRESRHSSVTTALPATDAGEPQSPASPGAAVGAGEATALRSPPLNPNAIGSGISSALSAAPGQRADGMPAPQGLPLPQRSILRRV